MNGRDIFLGLKHIGEDLIEEAEYGTFPKSPAKPQKAGAKRLLPRSVLIAAVIAMLLMLVGCAVVYVLKTDALKIGETRDEKYVLGEDGASILGTETVTQNILTLAGLEGSAPYRASAEWYFYREELLASLSRMEQEGTLPEGYWESNAYQQSLSAEEERLSQKYGLKASGTELEFRTTRNLCTALGIERFHTASETVALTVKDGGCYDNGSFWMNMDFRFQDGQTYDVPSTWGILRWNRKDCFSRDYVLLEDTGDWKEWNYTTASGSNILILRSPSDWRGYILCDREEALLSVQIEARVDLGYNVDGKTWFEYIYLTDRQMEQIADAIDFTIHPRTPTQKDVANQLAASTADTQNGYTLSLKSVETDGYVARLVVGITAPEGMDIESLDIGTGSPSDELIPAFGEAYGSAGFNDVSDNDGLANTKDLVMVACLHHVDDAIPFAAGSVWTLRIEDLWVNKYLADERLLTEGEWSFPIVFGGSNADYGEQELIREPITVDASIGWRPDGSDVVQEVSVTSLMLRKFSAAIEHTGPDGTDLSFLNGKFLKAVMKDGSQIQLCGGNGTLYEADSPIDPAQVAHIEFADGTVLKVADEPDR